MEVKEENCIFLRPILDRVTFPGLEMKTGQKCMNCLAAATIHARALCLHFTFRTAEHTFMENGDKRGSSSPVAWHEYANFGQQKKINGTFHSVLLRTCYAPFIGHEKN